MLLCAGLLVPACPCDGSREPVVVATTERGTLLTAADLRSYRRSLSPYVQPRYQGISGNEKLLNDLVERELLLREARHGLSHGAERRALERFENEVALAALTLRVRKQIQSNMAGDVALRRMYDATPEQWNQPPQVRVSQILFKSAKGASRALGELQRTARTQRDSKQPIVDRNHFEHLAERAMKSGTAVATAVDLRFFSEDAAHVPMALRRAAFQLTANGQLHGAPIAVAAGHAVIMRTARREALRRTFEDVRHVLQERWLREQTEQRLDRRRKEALKNRRMRIHREALDTVIANLPEGFATPGEAAGTPPQNRDIPQP